VAAYGITPRILRSQALELVEEAIISGSLKPGDRINEVALAAEMDISRGTLREALRTFEQAGLLVSKPHRGTFVRSLSADDAGEIFELMGIVESRAVRRAMSLSNTELLTTARDRLDTFARVLADETTTTRLRHDADLAFHEAICRCSGSEILVDTWMRLRGMVLAVVVNAGQPTMSELQTLRSHQELLDVIEAGSADDAEAGFRAHWRDAGSSIVVAMTAVAVAGSTDGGKNDRAAS
jgi:DNA-binding GntR family transcriptional regulator